MRAFEAEYMVWAKRMSHERRVRYGLAASNVPHLSFDDLGVDASDLAIASGEHYGWAPLREAVAARHEVDETQVGLTAGTTIANLVALAATVGRGDRVLVEHPTYTPLRRAVEWLGCEVVEVGRPNANGFAPDLDAIDRGFAGGARLLVLTNLHNPSGVRLGREAIEAVAAIARRRGGRVLVDEVYREFVFDGTEPAAFRVAPDVCTSTGGFAKVHGLGELRHGFLLADPKVVDRALKVYDILVVENAHVADRLALAAYRRMDRIIGRARTIVDARMPLLRAFVERRDDVSWVSPSGGIMGFVRLPEGSTGRAFAEALLEREATLVVPGEFFGAPDHVRVAAALPEPDLHEALARLGRGLDGVPGLRVS